MRDLYQGQCHRKASNPVSRLKKAISSVRTMRYTTFLARADLAVVYLTYSHITKDVYALKTFQDEFLENLEIRERFRKEINVWVELGHHPYLVHANFVDEVAGRLYIAMEYIAPNEEGLNSLDGYLQRHPPDLAQSLRWAIQILPWHGVCLLQGIACSPRPQTGQYHDQPG